MAGKKAAKAKAKDDAPDAPDDPHDDVGEDDDAAASGKCKHLKTSVRLSNVRKTVPHADLTGCRECAVADGAGKKDGKKAAPKKSAAKAKDAAAEDAPATASLWVCLTCGNVGCGRDGKGHALQHHEGKKTHCIVLATGSRQIWCYECDAELFAEDSEGLVECLKIVEKKLGSKTAATTALSVSKGESDARATTTSSTSVPSAAAKGASLPPGLSNLGNTCFFNSAIQNLSALRPFTSAVCGIPPNADALWEPVEDFPLVPTHRHGTLTFDPDVCGRALVDAVGHVWFCEGPSRLRLALAEFFGVFGASQHSGAPAADDGKKGGKHAAPKATVTPQHLFGEVCKKAQRFRSLEQQDAHELLRYLLDGIRTEDTVRAQKALLAHFGIDARLIAAARQREAEAKERARKRLAGTAVDEDEEEEPARGAADKGEESADSDWEKADASKREKKAAPKQAAASPASLVPPEVKEKLRKLKAALVTPVDAVFAGRLASTVTCLECGRQSQRVDPFFDLSVQIPSEGPARGAKRTAVTVPTGDGNSRVVSLSKHQLKKAAKGTRKPKKKARAASTEATGAAGETPGAENGEDGKAEADDEEGGSASESEEESAATDAAPESAGADGAVGALASEVSALSISGDAPDSAVGTGEGTPASESATPAEEEQLVTPSGPRFASGKLLRDAGEEGDSDEEEENKESEGVTIATDPISPAPATWPVYGGKDVPTLEQCLGDFFAPESLAGADAYACERCARKTTASRGLIIGRPPNVLTVHLKRFAVSMTGIARKISRRVAFPLDLDMSPFCSKSALAAVQDTSSGVRYRLRGVVEHSGTMRGGHYVAHLRTEGGGWAYASDTHVAPETEQKALGAEAFLLFYERV